MLILVADDSRSARFALKRALEKSGYEVIEAADGREALKLFGDRHPDLVTMDVQMPEMDGFDATAAIRSTAAGRLVPIVFVTGKDTMADRELGFKMGATEFISKKTPAPWLEVARTADRILKPETILQGANILVIEDDDVTRMIIATCLLQQGVKLLEAGSREEALEICSFDQGNIDMVIADYRFIRSSPDENLIAAFRQRLGIPHLPVIIISNVDERENVIDIFNCGATDYIMRPFIKEEFLARVRIHLDSRRLVRELNRNVMELERLSKLRDEFVAVASHDLKTPLNGIMGFTQLMQLDENLDKDRRCYLGQVITSSRFMLEIVNDIVELSRNEVAADTIDLASLNVRDAAKMAVSSIQQNAAAKGVLLEMTAPWEKNLIIAGDDTKFKRILNNLLSNAIKFTPEGGRVTLAIDQREDSLLVEVRDTGIGISGDMMPTLFDRFTKTSRKGTAGEPGTGLGMSITKQLVDLHQGKIQVTSKEGEGTVFQLTFPLLRG